MKRLLMLLLISACAHAPRGGDDSVKLKVGDKEFTLGELRAQVPPETVRAFDPYYQREKSFEALPLEPILKRVYGDDVATHEFVLRATDGYTVPINGARLLEGAYLAFADSEGPWEPIGANKANPGPWYVVWKDKTDLTTHPRPWALASITREKFETVFPLLVPKSDDAKVMKGFQLFRDYCVKCHAMNQQGGHVGPELNIPQNVTEYRDEKFLRAWIADPSQFRISVMPPSPQIGEDDMTALLAYLHAMKSTKVKAPKSAH